MKKILIFLFLSFFLFGCTNEKEEYENKVNSCPANTIVRKQSDDSFYECWHKDSYCQDLCSRLFLEVADTWGADGSNENISENILQCFNQCLNNN